MSPSEWATKHYFIAPEEASSPGRYRLDRFPYLPEILDAFADPLVREIAIPKAGQVGWTKMMTAIVGYHIDYDPCRILLAQPTQDEAEIWSKDRFEPDVQASPRLRQKLRPRKSRDANNTIRHKKFRGGAIKAVGANAPTGLSSWAARVGLADEVDRYPRSAKEEGDPLRMMKKRLQSFWNSKFGTGSTPDLEGYSRIMAEYEGSDQREFLVPCPLCGHEQILLFFPDNGKGGIRWDKDEAGNHRSETARYECVECEAHWSDIDRLAAIRKGRWVAHAPFHGRRGYWIRGLLSPFVRHEEMARKWLEARHDEEARKTFYNLELGEPYRQSGEAPDWKRIYDRREAYRIGTCPFDVVFLTAGADVQIDRIEVGIWGWGRNGERWLIEHRVLYGQTNRPDVWEELRGLLEETWPHESGADLRLRKLGVDAGAFTPDVYGWVRKQDRQRVHAVDGRDDLMVPVGVPAKKDVSATGKKLARGLSVIPVGVSYLKQELLLGRMKLDAPIDGKTYPQGWVHLPQVSDIIVQQLVSEERVALKSRGRTKLQWNVISGRRNEVLDCAIYARAMASMLGWDRMKESDFQRIERLSGIEEPAPTPIPALEKVEPAEVGRPAARPIVRPRTTVADDPYL